MSRRYQVQYTTTGFDTRFKAPFDTFEDAQIWARRHVGDSWWVIANYYGSGKSIDTAGQPKESE